MLLYGDAVAHINIARRVFDSRTPGLLQLGTVWLPLPHLLILPFIVSKQMWQSGSGGSIPSMAAFVFGVLGIFRLVRTVTGPRRRRRLCGADGCMGGGNFVCRESEFDLHAGDRDGRVAVSGFLYLGGRLFRRIYAGKSKGAYEVRAVFGGGMFDAL